MYSPEPRILLVDDEVDVRERIAQALEGRGRIDQFGDVRSASEAIRKARADGWEYAVAILDFCLPRFPGDLEALVDESLCALLRSHTTVWHISAHFDNSAVGEHVKHCHSADQAPNMLPKDVGYTRELERQVTQALAVPGIRFALETLRGSSDESAVARRYRPDTASCSDTVLRERLRGDALAYWSLLPPALQDEFREYFDVTIDAEGKATSVYER